MCLNGSIHASHCFTHTMVLTYLVGTNLSILLLYTCYTHVSSTIVIWLTTSSLLRHVIQANLLVTWLIHLEFWYSFFHSFNQFHLVLDFLFLFLILSLCKCILCCIAFRSPVCLNIGYFSCELQCSLTLAIHTLTCHVFSPGLWLLSYIMTPPFYL